MDWKTVDTLSFLRKIKTIAWSIILIQISIWKLSYALWKIDAIIIVQNESSNLVMKFILISINKAANDEVYSVCYQTLLNKMVSSRTYNFNTMEHRIPIYYLLIIILIKHWWVMKLFVNTLLLSHLNYCWTLASRLNVKMLKTL